MLIAAIVRVAVRLFVSLDVCVCTPVQVCGLVSYMNRLVGRLWFLLAILDWISQSPSVLGFDGLCQGCYKKGVSIGGVRGSCREGLIVPSLLFGLRRLPRVCHKLLALSL